MRFIPDVLERQQSRIQKNFFTLNLSSLFDIATGISTAKAILQGEGEAASCYPRKAGLEVGKIEFLLSPCQLLWQGEYSDKYYMLSKWKHKNIGLALKFKGENLKAKFVRRLLYYVFGIVEIAKHALVKCNSKIWR